MSGEAPDTPPPALSHAGAVVDQAIAYMVGQDIGSLEIASALLAGAFGLLGRSLSREGMLAVLDEARKAAASGRFDDPRP